LTDIAPGTFTLGRLAYELVGNTNLWHRFTHFVEIDPFQLQIVKREDNVYVILNADALDLADRIVKHEEHQWNTSK
jgi:hypothetical protein